MAAPGNSRLQNMLQSAVQSIQWTYSLFWQLNPSQGTLVWGDGYYNGAIKTRKTVQPMEVSAEEASLQRSQQLRELYDSLSAGETNQPARRPCAALSPEDLTESEWFYLMCVSFTFPPGVGLPGKAYTRRQHVWLTGANEVDSKVFSRAILAKSARVQTVVCIPILDGVVEFGTIDLVQEDLGLVEHVKTFFTDHQHRHHNPPPKPALSGHSTSNPTTSSGNPHFHSPSLPAVYTAADPPIPNDVAHDEEDEDEEDEEEEEAESDSEAETARNQNQNPGSQAMAEPSELMQLEMSEDIRLGSPDDASNNLEPEFNLLGTTTAQTRNPIQHRADLYRAESIRKWPSSSSLQDPLSTAGHQIQPPPQLSGPPMLDELTQEDTHYSQTVSTILQHQALRWPPETPSSGYALYSSQSAFAKWTTRCEQYLHAPSLAEGNSQWLLKYILFSVPFLHNKYRDENSPKLRDNEASGSRFRKSTPQDELSANHVLAERRRREKLNERFIILRSLVPFVTKMDKASILGDTIEYVKQLRRKIQDLETRTRQMEVEQQRLKSLEQPPQRTTSGSKEQRSGLTGIPERTWSGSGSERRKIRAVEGSSAAKPVTKVVEPPVTAGGEGLLQVQVSIIETDALVELQCPYREGLLLDVMVTLREHRIETTTVQSSLTNGSFVAELRAKVKENVNGKKVTIAEVKRAIYQIIPQC